MSELMGFHNSKRDNMSVFMFYQMMLKEKYRIHFLSFMESLGAANTVTFIDFSQISTSSCKNKEKACWRGYSSGLNVILSLVAGSTPLS